MVLPTAPPPPPPRGAFPFNFLNALRDGIVVVQQDMFSL
jgi:hypothetical protein